MDNNSSLVIYVDVQPQKNKSLSNIDFLYTSEKKLDETINRALSSGKYGSIVVIYGHYIDTDIILRLIKELDKNDVVYLTSPKKFGILSKVINKVYNTLIRLWSNTQTDFNDICIGVSFRTSCITKIPLKMTPPYLLHSVLAHSKRGVRLLAIHADIPKIRFPTSKFIGFIKNIIRFGKITGEFYRSLKFAIVGISGIIVNESTLWLITEYLHKHPLISSIFAIELSILSNFIFNDIWTFRDRREPGFSRTISRLAKYNAISWSTGSINWVILATLKEFMGMYYLVANLFGIFAAFVGNLLLSSFWAWKPYTKNV